MSYREFVEWIAFIRIEQGRGEPPPSRDGGWGQFKQAMLQRVAAQKR